MTVTRSFWDNLIWAIVTFGGIWLTLSLFAFMLPVVLFFLITAFALRYWRFYKIKKLLNESDLFTRVYSTSQKSQKKSDVIDAEYEILDDNKK